MCIRDRVYPTGVVKAICISDRRGIEKHSIEEGHFIIGFGIEGDDHGGNWHRKVSLLSYDKVKAFNERGANVIDGAFGEDVYKRQGPDPESVKEASA